MPKVPRHDYEAQTKTEEVSTGELRGSSKKKTQAGRYNNDEQRWNVKDRHSTLTKTGDRSKNIAAGR